MTAEEAIQDLEAIRVCRVMGKDRTPGIRMAIEALRFKAYFDTLYGQGREITNWHQNGETEPFDNFYDSAVSQREERMA
ncbi:MAG: hypothetical protein IJV64_01375 [Oscillospiraceae bacterium]|nr:hypothetical protein [Oscillospiraceae bacterium]